MGEERQKTYIVQEKEGEGLFSKLQRQTLDEVQRLSGDVWTDYNPHDSGVTLSEVANYALMELDYKFSFPIEDYLTERNCKFDPKRMGLFLPEEVFTTEPVTKDDYKRLLLSEIPEIDNVYIECPKCDGRYNIEYTMSQLETNDKAQVEKQITSLMNKHRNLCEQLGAVKEREGEQVEIFAELTIANGQDATQIVANVYATSLEGNVRMEHELYKRLLNIEGIESFRFCYFKDKEGKPLSTFPKYAYIKIPTDARMLTIRVFCGDVQIRIDFRRFLNLLRKWHYSRKHCRGESWKKDKAHWSIPRGEYREIFKHTPLSLDFPMCYNLSEKRDKPTSFEAYLKLYDRVIKDGLKQVAQMPQGLSIAEEGEDQQYSMELQKSYLDFLDNLYGVDSDPEWLRAQNHYGEQPKETLLRRKRFLRQVAQLTKGRSKARDINRKELGENILTIKRWFCLLLGINYDEDKTVGNVLPTYNFRIMEKSGSKDGDWLTESDSAMILERMLYPHNTLPIDMDRDGVEEDERDDYTRLRQDLSLFNENRIRADLFRGGTSIDNYFVVKVNDNSDYMLVFHSRRSDEWINLGRGKDKSKLMSLAKVLRRFLLKLNRECETLYVFEPILIDESRPFELELVLSGWTDRFHNPRFREACEDFLRSIVPAHITIHIHWLGMRQMQKFENCYRTLMIAFNHNELERYKQDLYDGIKSVLTESEQP